MPSTYIRPTGAAGSRSSLPTIRRVRSHLRSLLCLLLALLPLAAKVQAQAQAQAPADTPLPDLRIEERRLAPPSSLSSLSSDPSALTPLTVSSVGAQRIADEGIRGLSDLARDLPSVSDSYNTFGYVENLQVRGFALDETLNTQRDGLSVSSHVPVSLENKEAVEVLQGVSGMLAGTSAPGGMVNYVLKTPPANDLAQAAAEVSERGSVLLRADLGGHLGEARSLGYRLNAAFEDRHPEIDHAWSRRAMASGFFDLHATGDTLVQAEFELQRVQAISVPGYALVDTQGIGTGTTVPAPVDPRWNLNAQPWTQPFESRSGAGSLRIVQALAGGWELVARTQLQRSATNDRIAFPDGCSAAVVYVYNGLCAGGWVDIWRYESNDERRDTLETDLRARGTLQAAGLQHELTLGARALHHVERYPLLQTYNFAGSESIYAPVPLPASADPSSPNAPLDLHEQELYAWDRTRLGAGASAWAGLRATRIGQHSALTDGSQATQLSQQFATPWLGLGWEPRPGTFAWVSAGSGVEITSVPNHPVTVRETGGSLQLANAGQALPALRSRQIEAGIRGAGAPGQGWSATLFRIEKPFADNIAVDATSAVEVAGARRQRNQGLELDARQSLAAGGLGLRAAATLLDARTVLAPEASWVGHQAVNTARCTGVLEAEARPRLLAPLHGGTSSGVPVWWNRLHLSSPITALPDGSARLPSSWQWDSAARWESDTALGRQVVRLGVDNVTDRRYWREAPMAPWGSIYLFPAAARTLRLGIEITR